MGDLYTALVIDDNKDICEYVERVLMQTGHFRSVIKAFDGLDASLKLIHQSFDLLIIDLLMPKLPGLEFLKNMKKEMQQKELPVIIISGNFRTQSVNQAIKLGVKHMLSKPFKRDDLLEKVKIVLNIS